MTADYSKISDALDEKGWIKGDLRSANGLCLIGAARYANGLLGGQGGVYLEDEEKYYEAANETNEVINTLAAVAERLFPGRTTHFNDRFHLAPAAQFNDHPDTTLEDVKMVIKHAGSENA